MPSTNIEVSSLINPFIKAMKIANDEYKHFFEIGLEDYLNTQTEKYLYTNTFLHRAEKVYFFDIYFPIKASYGEDINYFEDIKRICSMYKSLTIIGLAGSGKSTLTKFIFLNSIKQSFKIPILIELRHLNDFDGNIENLIFNKILKNNIEPSERIAKRALKAGDFLFLLDGYDEIFLEKKQKVNAQIDSFIDSYSHNNFIITTRPGSGIEGFPRFHNFYVNELSSTEIISFVNLMVKDVERRYRIITTIQDPINNNYSKYLSNPLLLSMFILAFESHPEIPKKKNAFYRNVFDTLYSKHDGITKNSFPREKKTRLQRDDFQKILELFSFLSYIPGVYSFTFDYFSDTIDIVKKRYNLESTNTEDLIYDLETSISIFIKDGFEYKFPHRSMQEYFAAEFASKVSSEKKHVVYSRLLKENAVNKTDDNKNMWNLCVELDELSFYRYFLITELKEIARMLDPEFEDIELIQNFLKIIVPSVYLHPTNDDTFPNELKLYRNTNFEVELIGFCGFYDFMTYFHFFQESGSQKEFQKYLKHTIEEWAPDIFYEDLPTNVAAIRILIKYKFQNLIGDFYKLLIEVIKKYEKKVSEESDLIDEALGF